MYVASYPEPPHGELPEPSEWIDDDPLLRRLGDGTFVLDTDLWFEAESHKFDPEILAHLREHRRRPVSLRALTDANPGKAWATTPFTVLLGRTDPLLPYEDSVEEIASLMADTNLGPPDIRTIESDHFIVFRHPDAVADLHNPSNPSRERSLRPEASLARAPGLVVGLALLDQPDDTTCCQNGRL